MMSPTRVLLVDDHATLRRALAALLCTAPDILVVGEADDGAMGIARALALQPDVVLMDVNMPGMDGIEATRRLQAQAPHIRILGFSMHCDPAVEHLMRLAGAAGFLGKHAPLEALLTAIRALRRTDAS